MTRWNRALVTGASSGIRRAIAEQLAADGTRLVVVARDEQWLRQLADRLEVDVNVVALQRLSQVAAAVLVERGGGGGILNVSSIAAFAPAANSATYAATKAFVSSLSEGLHAEIPRVFS